MGIINEGNRWTQVMHVLFNMWDRCICLFPPITPAEFTIDAPRSDGGKFFCKLPGCIGCRFGVCKGTLTQYPSSLLLSEVSDRQGLCKWSLVGVVKGSYFANNRFITVLDFADLNL
jgi:hypothetical protein